MSLFKKNQTETYPSKTQKPNQTLPGGTSTPSFLQGQEVRTSLGADAVISGRLSFTTPTRIEGKLKGEIHCTSLLIIGQSAVVEGIARADEICIEGLVRGDIINTRKVEISSTGIILGRIHAESIVIQEGGTFDGTIRMSTEKDSDRNTSTG